MKALLGQEKLRPSSPRPPPASVVFPWKSSRRKTQGTKKNLVFIRNLECKGFCSFQWGFDSYRCWNVFRTCKKMFSAFLSYISGKLRRRFFSDRSGERWMQMQTLFTLRFRLKNTLIFSRGFGTRGDNPPGVGGGKKGAENAAGIFLKGDLVSFSVERKRGHAAPEGTVARSLSRGDRCLCLQRFVCCWVTSPLPAAPAGGFAKRPFTPAFSFLFNFWWL